MVLRAVAHGRVDAFPRRFAARVMREAAHGSDASI
jgi:hypothetical protein